LAHRRKAKRSTRPRKPGTRTPSGRLSRAYKGAARDEGTRDAERHRLALVNGGDPALASSPLGILLANGCIDRDQERAGQRYAAVRAILFGPGRPSVSSDVDEPHTPTLRTDEHLEGLRNRFESMVRQLGPDQKVALDHVVVDGKLPTWFSLTKARRQLRPVDEAERAALLDGLERLAADSPAQASPDL
jgi:hypothetical protein